MAHDIGRDEQLDDELIRRLVMVSRDIYSHSGANAHPDHARHAHDRVCRCRRLRDEWRRHFPSRPGDVALPA